MKRSREPEDDHSHRSADGDDSNSVPPDCIPQHTHKFAEVDSDGEPANTGTMTCLLHSSTISFNSYTEYESHYNKEHTNRCVECRKNFPSPHLLGLHIEELHDAFAAVKREKGERTFSCFVEDCERKCSTADKRRRHLIDKHMYPRNFFFSITRDGINGRRSLLNEGRSHHQRKPSSTQQKKEVRRKSVQAGEIASPQQEEEVQSGKDDDGEGKTQKAGDTSNADMMDDLAGAMSALRFVPPSVRFGRGRAGFART